MIWAALVLVMGMAGVSVFAWYMTRRMESARQAGTEVRFARRASWIPIAVGVVIIAEGVTAAVITKGWLVLLPVTCVGLLTVILGVQALRRLQRVPREHRPGSYQKPTGLA